MQAQDLGVDALGFVFVPDSARYIAPAAAVEIVHQLSPFVTAVGLFLNASNRNVSETLELMPGLLPQFHGQESAEFCDSFKRPYIKALGVANGLPSPTELATFEYCCGFLFDSNAPGALGGTGHTFDWNILEKNLVKPLILAGGLTVDNVGSAIEMVMPHSVDVSSGVEQSKGVKSAERMDAFMREVRLADAQIHSASP